MRSQASMNLTSNTDGRLLVVAGDELPGSLTAALAERGLRCERSRSVVEAEARIASADPQAVLVDLGSLPVPEAELLQLVRRCAWQLPVLLLTPLHRRDLARRAVAEGAWGYSRQPVDPDEVAMSAQRALDGYRLRGDLASCRRSRMCLVGELRHLTDHLRQQQESLIANLATALRYRDGETGAHVERIGRYSAALARALGWPEADADDLCQAAKLHDVGKIGLPDRLLLKPARLTPIEFEEVKRHTEIGAEILAEPDLPLLRLAREIALAHHERWDGSGYPYGLCREAIPASARIVAVADVYDALVHPRVYRPRLEEATAVGWMRAAAAGQFDPEVFACFLDLLPELRSIRQEVVEVLAGAAPTAAVVPAQPSVH